jgi:hypothetical protein
MGRRKLPQKKVVMSFVVTEEIRDYLRSLPNYSQYICELIENDRITAEDLDEAIDDTSKTQLKAILNRLFGE